MYSMMTVYHLQPKDSRLCRKRIEQIENRRLKISSPTIDSTTDMCEDTAILLGEDPIAGVYRSHDRLESSQESDVPTSCTGICGGDPMAGVYRPQDRLESSQESDVPTSCTGITDQRVFVRIVGEGGGYRMMVR